MKSLALQLVSVGATSALEQMTTSLEVRDSRVFGEINGHHVPATARRLADYPAGPGFVLGQYHHYRVGATPRVLADPEVVLLRLGRDEWLPVSVRTPFGHAITADAGGTPLILNPRGHARVVELVDAWLGNLTRAHLVRGRAAVSHRALLGAPWASAAE